MPSGENMNDLLNITHWLLDLVAAIARKVGRWP
jgi:hypothetical protein